MEGPWTVGWMISFESDGFIDDSVSRELHSSPESLWEHEICPCNVWRNFGAGLY